MRFVLTALILLGGIFYVFNGISFLVSPASQSEGFGLPTADVAGLSTIRADLTAFFLVAGAAMIWGAWKRNGDVLLIPAALLAIAFLGRLVSLFADGTYDGWYLPMAAEAVTVLLTLAGSRMLPHHHLDEFDEDL